MNKSIVVVRVILTTVLMGPSFTIGKIGLVYTSPMLLAAIRFIMTIVVTFIKRPHPKKVVD